MPESTTRARNRWFTAALPGTPDSPVVYVVPQAGLGAGATTPLVRALAPGLRAHDLRMTETYRVGETVLDVPVVAVSSPADARFGPERVLPWGRRTRAEFRAVELAGDHDHFTAAPDRLAAVVRDSLPLFGCAD